MGWFKRRADSSDELDELKSSIAAMAERLERAGAGQRQLDRKIEQRVATVTAQIDEKVDSVTARLGEQVDGIAHRLDQKDSDLPPPPTVETADINSLRDRLDELAARLEEVDQRITSISTELANQLSEISNDVEAIGGNEPPTDEVVGELRDAQARLANEQARYQIAFRQDLADLADRLRKR